VTLQSRLQTMKRLAAACQVIEDAAKLTLDHAQASMQNTAMQIEQQASVARGARLLGQGALVHEDHLGWLMNESQREIAVWNMVALDQMLQKYQKLTHIATELHHDRLLQREQMDLVVERLRIQNELENRRREQASLDHRYLSRTLWLQRREAKRVKPF
jgi:hypothetical protein